MAKGKKTGGKSFTKGIASNPVGRPRLPDDVKELKKLNRTELERYLSELLLLTPAQLEKVEMDPEATVLKRFLLAIINKGTERGDPVRLGFLFDQLLGKVKDRIEASGSIKVILEDYSSQ